MTTDWTAIGRRLAVGRRANRPPWSRRTNGHRPILAPLAATVAATVAVGVVLARSNARRAQATRRREPPELGLLAGEAPGQGVRRMAIEQTDLAIGLLTETKGALRPEAVHEVRKALKRLRALVRLLRGELGEREFERENRVLRDLGRRLAGARDAEVLLDTLRDLVERNPKRLRRGGIARLERRLLLEREGVRARVLTDAAMRAEVVAALRELRARAAAWQLRERDGTRAIEPGLRRIYGTGRRRYRRAERGKGERTRALHSWRKAVKDLRYAGEALSVKRQPAGAPADAASRNGAPWPPARAARARSGRRMRRIARRADHLGELLGSEHDLAILGALVSAGRAPLGVRLSRRTRKRLLRAIARRRRELRVRALRDGDALYERRPKRLLRDARRDLLRTSN
jgi:CHAD domain-containing protein